MNAVTTNGLPDDRMNAVTTNDEPREVTFVDEDTFWAEF